MAMVVTAGVNAPGPAEARCQGDQVRRFNYETKKSDCVAMEDAEETKRDRLLRQQRQPRHQAEVMQRSRKLEQQRVQQQRALERSRIKAVQDQRIRAQQQLNAQRRLRQQQVLLRQKQLRLQRVIERRSRP